MHTFCAYCTSFFQKQTNKNPSCHYISYSVRKFDFLFINCNKQKLYFLNNNMTTKRCSYKNCNSFSTSSHPSTETFYSFPKQPDRLQIWMQLGGCPNEKEIPYASRYFCSKHFDESKYVASNPRRKQLLSTAVPYPCIDFADQNDLSIGVISVEDTDYQCEVSSGHAAVEEQDLNEVTSLHVDVSEEEASHETNCVSDTVDSLEHFYEEYTTTDINGIDIEENLEIEKRILKRKLDSPNHSIPKQAASDVRPEKSKVVVCSVPTSTMKINRQKREQPEVKPISDAELELEKLADDSNITTFIFKGEEYVQMPKERYMSEKMLLINKIKSYEETLKNIKHLMDNVKL